MTSVLTSYSQSDTRVVPITLTGFVTDNGTAVIASPQVEQPAYGEIDLTLSKNFSLDGRQISLRAPYLGTNYSYYLLHLYISSVNPPRSSSNREFNVFFTPPIKTAVPSAPGGYIFIRIYTNRDDAYNNVGNTKYVLVNVINIAVVAASFVSQGEQILTFQCVNNTITLKALPSGCSLVPPY